MGKETKVTKIAQVQQIESGTCIPAPFWHQYLAFPLMPALLKIKLNSMYFLHYYIKNTLKCMGVFAVCYLEMLMWFKDIFKIL